MEMSPFRGVPLYFQRETLEGESRAWEGGYSVLLPSEEHVSHDISCVRI